MTSQAEWRASASAIWLRQVLPIHTKRIFLGCGICKFNGAG
jgi:hypothetical protein